MLSRPRSSSRLLVADQQGTVLPHQATFPPGNDDLSIPILALTWKTFSAFFPSTLPAVALAFVGTPMLTGGTVREKRGENKPFGSARLFSFVCVARENIGVRCFRGNFLSSDGFFPRALP